MKHLALILFIGCSTSDSEPVLVDCPACGSGEIRFAVGYGYGSPSIAALGDGGVLTSNSESVRAYDAAFVRQAAPVWSPASANGVFYGFDSKIIGGDEVSPRYRYGVKAMGSDGKPRWRSDLPLIEGYDHYRMAANDDGVYAYTNYASGKLTAFSPDGTTRFEDRSPNAIELVDGAFVAAYNRKLFAAPPATVERRTAANTVVWAKTLTSKGAPSEPENTVYFDDLAVTSTGHVVVAGEFAGTTLDFGDRVVAGDGHTNFVAELDQNGATLWAHVFHVGGSQTVDVLSTAEIGYTSHVGRGSDVPGLGATDGEDAMIAIVSANGFERVRMIGGPGFQATDGVVVGGNGSLWLSVRNSPGHLSDIPGQLTVGSRTFDSEHAGFLLNIAP